jgi:hypothetical protein
MAVIERLQHAMNAHDLDAFVACFAPDYESTFPAHPDRAFRGKDQVRKNWAHNFSEIPDMEATLLRSTPDGETVWTEWEWTGTLTNGAQYLMRGVVIIGVREDHIAWARLYTEPVEEGGAGIDAAIRRSTGNPTT